jgi:hypothetical protein
VLNIRAIELARAIERRFGDAVRERFGIELAGLTFPEAFYLRRPRHSARMSFRASLLYYEKKAGRICDQDASAAGRDRSETGDTELSAET